MHHLCTTMVHDLVTGTHSAHTTPEEVQVTHLTNLVKSFLGG